MRTWNLVFLAIDFVICQFSHIDKWLLLDRQNLQMGGNEEAFRFLFHLSWPNDLAVINFQPHFLTLLREEGKGKRTKVI